MEEGLKWHVLLIFIYLLYSLKLFAESPEELIIKEHLYERIVIEKLGLKLDEL